MDKAREMNLTKMNRISKLGVAYDPDQEEFVLVFNATKDDYSDGEAYILPATALQSLVKGLEQSGIEYQRNTGKNIGFANKEE